MVCGGESYETLIHDLRIDIDPNYPDDLIYEKKGGFGLFVWGFLDSHFGTRGRQGRMIRIVWDLMNMNKTYKGNNMIFGIDENTALIVDGDKAKVIGESGVFLIDLSKVTTNSKEFQLGNIKVRYLTDGDYIDLLSFGIEFADWKKNIKGFEEHDYA